jgi:thiamine biosynthesis lipoprotein
MIDRRVFLKLAGWGTAALAGSGVLSPLAAIPFDRNLYHVSQTRPMMGTFFTVSVFHEDGAQAEDALGRAFERAARWESLLTRFSDQSPVAFLNREGALKSPELELREVIRLARQVHRLSGGAFDITVKPLVDALQYSFTSSGHAPDSAEMSRLLPLVGMEHMECSPEKIGFHRSGMGITLDGIAKGYIVDRTAEFLWAQGLHHVLVNGGGDIRTIGGRSPGRPWRIAIRDPERAGGYAAVIYLTDGAVATSGSYEIYFDRERLFHHILDPDSGICPQGEISVTAVCTSAAMADGLSTAVFVLESERGLALLNELPDVEGMIITRSGKKHLTTGWTRLTL